MCAMGEESSHRISRRRAALIPALMALFSSVWLLLIPRHGAAVSDTVLGLGFGVLVGISILALIRRRG